MPRLTDYRPRHARPGARPRPLPRIWHTGPQSPNPAPFPPLSRLPDWVHRPARPRLGAMTGPELASHIRVMEHEHRQQRREKSVIGRMVPWCLFGGLNICAVAVPLIAALTVAAD